MSNIFQTWYLICNFTKGLAPLYEGRNFRKNIAINKKLDKRMATTDESDFYFVLVFGFLLLLYSILFFVLDTGKSLSEALLFAEHWENMNVGNNFCTQHVLPRFELKNFPVLNFEFNEQSVVV